MKTKRKRCKYCGELFEPLTSFQKTCSISCAIPYVKTEDGRKSLEKNRRRENRKRKAELKPMSKLRQEAQQAFNAYIRERDRDLPCISCGRYHEGQWHAGHYRSVGAAPELRFNEKNVWKQCAPCNNHKSGNLVEYRINLIKRIGLEEVEWLEGPHDPKKYTRDELIQIKKDYRAKLRELQNEMFISR